MKCLVIGGAGFVGSHLVDHLLKAGHQVTVYDNLRTGRESFLRHHRANKRFRFEKRNLMDLKSLTRSAKGRDIIFHLATNSDIIKAMNNPGLDFELGIRGTFNVLEAMRLGGVRKLVYLSGSGVYGDFGSKFVPENAGPLTPKSMYGAAKLSSEAMISAYSHLYGIQAWVFRPANIIGPRPTHGVIYDFIQKLKKNPKRLEIRGNGTQSKSYIHVDDVMRAILFVFKRAKSEFNVFNLATETYISVKEIAAAVLREMKLKKTKLVFGKSNRGWKGDVPVYRLSIQAIKRLGWKPRYSSKQAVVKTIREILNNV